MKELMHLDHMLLRNSVGDWLVALGFTVAIVLSLAVIRPILIRRFSRLAQHMPDSIHEPIVRSIRATKTWLIAIIAVDFGSEYLDLPHRVERGLGDFATVAFFLQAGLWIGTLIEQWISHSRRRALGVNNGAATTLNGIGYIAKLALWVVMLLLMLDNLGVNITALAASLGIGGIAVALAVQNILGDLLASLSIMIDKPFVLGDSIAVDTFSGNVEHIGLKTTRIRSDNGEQIVFANSDLLKSRLRNYKQMRERRIVFTFGVLYQTTPEQLEAIPALIKEIIAARPDARFHRAHFKEFGDSAYNFEVVYWVLDQNYIKYMDIQQAINLAMVRIFAERGIGFAFPSRTLYVEGPIGPVKLSSQSQ
jgi:small-conductance mechanosensitive channel